MVSGSGERSRRPRARLGLVSCRTGYPPTDSPSVHIYQVWHRLREMGYEVYTWGPHAVPGRVEHPRTQIGLGEMMREVDLLYVRFPIEYFFGTLRNYSTLLRHHGTPVVCEFNAPLYQFTRDVPWLAPWAIRKRARLYLRNHAFIRSFVDHAVCTCRELAGYAREHFGIRDVTVIPDGADPEQFHPRHRPEGRRLIEAGPDDFIVFWAGITKYRWQGLDQLMEAARALEGSDVRFVLAGDSTYLPEPLPANVETLGHVPYFDMPKYMAAADVSLCIYESYDWCPIGFWGSPLKLFEYMASGRPVIASRMGQIARVIDEGKNGYLTDGETDDLVTKIGALATDRDLADAMGRAARDTVLEGYTWQGAAECTEDIFSALLQRVPGTNRAPLKSIRMVSKTGNRRPRVGFFSTYGGYGGTEEYLDKLMRGASERGHEVVFFHHKDSPEHWVQEVSRFAETTCFNGNGMVGPGARASGESEGGEQGPLWRVARRAYLGLTPHGMRHLVWFLHEAWRVGRVLAANPVDAIHFSDLGAEPGIVAARLAGIRRLTGALNCMPDTSGFYNRSFYRFLETLCLSCVDSAAAVSHHGRRLWLKRVRLNPRKVVVIHNSTELVELGNAAAVRQEVRQECGVPADAPVIGVSATLVPRKGHRYLLEAFPRVLRKVPNAWLMIAGDGPCREALEEFAQDLEVESRVTFLGHRADMDRVVHAYDVVALTSVAIESLPFALLEGMACRKPAVGTTVGGMPELIEDGVCGRVVPPRDPEALAQALVDVAEDPERMRAMGRAARRRVAEQFNAEDMVRETMDMVLGVPGREGEAGHA